MKAQLSGFQARAESDRVADEIRNAAHAAGAYNPDQFVDLLRSKARQLPNGEIVLRDVMPAALQSAAEAVDYMRADPSYANLFKDGV